MNRNTVYIRLLLVVVAVVAFLAFFNHKPQRAVPDDWLPSSFNPSGEGVMALYQTLAELNWPVERWREPLGRLGEEGAGNALLITRSATGWRDDFTPPEDDLLDAWVRRGNTLLLFGAFTRWDDTRELLRKFGFFLPDNSHSSTLTEFFAPFARKSDRTIDLQPTAENASTAALVFPACEPLPMILPKGARVLWQNNGQPYVIDLPVGAGRVVYAASAQWLDNRFLPRGGNLAALGALLAPAGQTPHRLIFEESHHGFSAIFAVAHLLDHPGIRIAAMLALLGLAAFLGSSFVRFGPVVPLRRESGRSTLEFVDSIADLYQRANLRNDVIAHLFAETQQRVLQRLHLPPTASHAVVAARLKQVHPGLPSWKRLAQRFDAREDEPGPYVSGLPPSGWLRVARELIQIKSAMA
jgi:hypothetical protein